REGVPGPGAGPHRTRWAAALAPRPAARWRRAQARESLLAEPGPAALRPARRPQAPDPPHVRAGRPRGRRPQARAHRTHRPRRPAAGAMALSRARRTFLSRPRRVHVARATARFALRPRSALALLLPHVHADRRRHHR